MPSMPNRRKSGLLKISPHWPGNPALPSLAILPRKWGRHRWIISGAGVSPRPVCCSPRPICRWVTWPAGVAMIACHPFRAVSNGPSISARAASAAGALKTGTDEERRVGRYRLALGSIAIRQITSQQLIIDSKSLLAHGFKRKAGLDQISGDRGHLLFLCLGAW